ncbi:MAG: hypothetical protein OXD32_07010, partial [Endozoicomonadaceae bacterium]|nr:hypothetical protein [Endozoicomonadaceae bacterium]
MTDIMANETKENIDVKAIIEENFNMLTANDFVNLINSLKEPEKTTQQEITLFKSLANEYIAIKVYNNLRSSEQKHMIQKWFQQGDLSFKVFKKEFSAYKNKKFDKLKGTITLVAGLDLQKYLDNDRIKELVSAKYPPATAIKQIWKIEKESIENARKEMKKTLTKNKECKFLKEIKGDSIYKLNPNYGSGAGTMYNIVNLLTNTKISDEAKMSRLFKILDKSSLVITDP